MKSALRRWLGALDLDEVCVLIQAALDDKEFRQLVEREEITAIARRETADAFQALTTAMERQRWGKD